MTQECAPYVAEALARAKLPIIVRAELRYLTRLGKHKVSVWVKGPKDWRNTSSPKRATRYYLEAVAAYLPIETDEVPS